MKENKKYENKNNSEKIISEIKVVQMKDKIVENKRKKMKYILILINSFNFVFNSIMLNLLGKGISLHCILFSIIFMSLFS